MPVLLISVRSRNCDPKNPTKKPNKTDPSVAQGCEKAAIQYIRQTASASSTVLTQN